MLTIRHLNGAQAGTDVKIDQAKERVVVGRQLDCDVQFPPEETQVARHHFGLVRKPSGSWTVELFGTPFVAIDGQPADNGQVARDGARIELGKIGGPALSLGITEDVRGDNYLRTAGQADAPSPRAIATQASTMARLARAIAAVAVVLAVGIGGFAYYSHLSAQKTAARLDTAQKEFSDALAREAETRIGADVRKRLARAVYNVQLVDTAGRVNVGGGTASVVGPHELATNGHVGVEMQTLRPGEKMIVRAPGENGAVYEVTSATIHPGYIALAAFVSSDIRARFSFRGLNQYGLSGNGYDVALLHVKETLPADERLEIASADELASLNSGTPLVTAGYPVELLQNNWALAKSATPELHVGVVTSVTDMFGLPAPYPHRQLVHFDMAATGGQSGSPVLAGSGHVVALLNSGNATSFGDGRLPSAALINFGQRADLVRDLLDGTAQKKLPDAQAYWVGVSKNFIQGKDVIVDELIEGSRRELGLSDAVRPRLMAEIKATLNASKGRKVRLNGVNDNGKPYDYDSYRSFFLSPQQLPTGYDYLFLVMAEGGETRLSIEMDGDVVATNLATNYPQISCRLLSPPQQDTGKPSEPRKPCATGHERTDSMTAGTPEVRQRDLSLVIWNNKDSDDTLLATDLNYKLRIYQWPAPNARSSSLSK